MSSSDTTKEQPLSKRRKKRNLVIPYHGLLHCGKRPHNTI